MSEKSRFLPAVQNRLETFLTTQNSTLSGLGEHPLIMGDVAQRFTSLGKRFRAKFAYWGWRSAQDADSTPDDAFRRIVDLGCALEVFHAAALVHDDLIDHSDTRRGAPAVHKQFEDLHSQSRWRGSASDFGQAAAILLGDLLIMWSDELFAETVTGLDATRTAALRDEFNRMRTQVTAGQYLDIIAEVAATASTQEALIQAERVVTYKSAKYSVESPLVLGALLGGAPPEHLASLRAYGLPLGRAYQLRDDLLGVFGDPAQTGKPSGDDLREGKRTVLVALALASSDDSVSSLVDGHLGDPAMDQAMIAALQDAITRSGAVDAVEERIAHHADAAHAALESAHFDDETNRQLSELVSTVTQRVA